MNVTSQYYIDEIKKVQRMNVNAALKQEVIDEMLDRLNTLRAAEGQACGNCGSTNLEMHRGCIVCMNCRQQIAE